MVWEQRAADPVSPLCQVQEMGAGDQENVAED